LNVIDDTNFPAANMRFFEIPCAGGLQVCSECPEMESEFKNGESVFYYKDHNELASIVRSLLINDSQSSRVSQYAHDLICESHTYKHRATRILELLNLSS